MENLRKAFIMLSAAIVMDSLATGEALADPTPMGVKGKGKKVTKKKKVKRSKKRVKKVKKAKRRPTQFDPDLSMPAGTAYDVIRSEDLG